MRKISRAAAKSAGKKRYFTGKPCARGHVAQRLVSNCGCVDCHNLMASIRGAANPEKRNAKQRTYYQGHKTEVRITARKWRRRNYSTHMLRAARKRSKESNVPFALTREDIVIPKGCPVLGIKLQLFGKRGSPHSPTLDRTIPSLGYVQGNVSVISHRANRIKTDASLAELRKVCDWLAKNVK